MTPKGKDLLEELTRELNEAARGVVERVENTMPEAYFNDTDVVTQVAHLKGIIAAEATGHPQEIRLRSECGARFTFIHERSYPGQLAQLLGQLPRQRPLLSATVHTATDGGLVLDVFEFGEPVAGSRDEQLLAGVRKRVDEVAAASFPELTPEMLDRHFAGCDDNYLAAVPVRQICEHASFLDELRGTQDTRVLLVPRSEEGLCDLRIGMGQVDPRLLFERIARYLGHRGVDIDRAYLSRFDSAAANDVSLFSLLVRVGEIDGAALESDLQRLKWLDEPTLALAYGHDALSLGSAELLLGLCRLTHQVLVRRVGPSVASQRVVEACERYRGITMGLLDLFENARTGARENLVTAIDNEVDSEEARLILRTLLEVCAECRHSNVSNIRRYATAIEVPAGLLQGNNEEQPFGVYFVHGRDFDGFHVRFRDIARGGMRIVSPRGWEQHTLESERLYQEAYGLAFAQQLKNKDIPEGGSKGVLLLAPGSDAEAAGRAYADALLDLLLAEGDRRLYLGPDENVSNALISWIVGRAAQRGYPSPYTFMSSKPGLGINHKEYGVTSEGVTVFLEVALNHLGIDPRQQPFTVKLTGGPDGDVAGNEIRILHREYGENVRIVGIADGSGCAEDPDGLNIHELLRLVDESLPIASFARECLGPGGRVLTVDEPGGLRARNTLHNRIVCDALVTAGGRPRTIHGDNWQQYLDAEGKPSSRLIVEGANLFLTPEARQHLSESGVVIVKDSSANKCGVICSSFEILASMIWTEDQFLTHKARFVSEVVDRLRALARLEAELLFEEHVHRPSVSLPELSTRLSRAIIRAADAVTPAIRSLRNGSGQADDLVEHLIAQHFPAVLGETTVGRLSSLVPPAYLESAVATILAARIVYREGLAYMEEMPDRPIAELALRYIQQELRLAPLVAQLRQSDLPDRDRIAQLINSGGTRAALRGPA